MIKVLVVDDDRATGGLLKTIFEMEGFKAIVCADPGRVLDLVRREKPDLLFMDFHLAEVDSLPVLREIKGDDKLKATPVIMTSGLDRSQECIQAGADHFVLKPFRPANLMDEVRSVLKVGK